MKDYYSILHVSSSASASEIKRSFRQLALKYHPDKNPDPAAETIFKEINEAYDVLSDSSKRQLYDQRLQNPFAEILTEASAPKRHRDPAYRPRPRPAGPNIPESVRLMMQYYKYVRWFSWVGVVFSSVIFLDFVLPYKVEHEKIISETSVRSRRGVAYVKFHAASGRSIKIYPEQLFELVKGDEYQVTYTRIFSTSIRIAPVYTNDSVSLAYLYSGGQVLFVIALFISSVIAMAFQKNIEFSFNANIASAALIIVVFVFL